MTHTFLGARVTLWANIYMQIYIPIYVQPIVAQEGLGHWLFQRHTWTLCSHMKFMWIQERWTKYLQKGSTLGVLATEESIWFQVIPRLRKSFEVLMKVSWVLEVGEKIVCHVVILQNGLFLAHPGDRKLSHVAHGLNQDCHIWELPSAWSTFSPVIPCLIAYSPPHQGSPVLLPLGNVWRDN